MSDLYIGIHGKKRAGKDKTADFIFECMKTMTDRAQYIFNRYAFALPLKKAVIEMFSLDKLFDDEVISTKQQQLENKKDEKLPFWDASYRELLQLVGTEIGRQLRKDLWIKNAEIFVNDCRKKDTMGEKILGYDRVFVFTDVRFDNEAEWIKNNNGCILHIHRSALDNIKDSHESESGIDEKYIDFNIHNDGSLELLKKEVFFRFLDILYSKTYEDLQKQRHKEIKEVENDVKQHVEP